jgi:hypothetical protein
MSNFEQKVAAATEWLQRQAAHGRLTNVIEVQTWTGLRLAETGARANGSSMPIDRDKAWAVLAEVARQSFVTDGFLLPALVVHFGDKAPGHRFVEWAIEAGLMATPQDAEQFVDENGERRLPITDEVRELHGDQLSAIFAKYGAGVPDDASTLGTAYLGTQEG